VPIGAALCAGRTRPAQMNDECLERDPPADMQRTFGFGDGAFTLAGIGAGERAVDDRSVDGDQLEAGSGDPLLKIRDTRGVVVVEVQARGEQLDDLEAMGGNFKKMIAPEPSLLIEVRRDAVLSGHRKSELRLL